eukprot:9132982-Lingulodinium_polyedra.AAC.1
MEHWRAADSDFEPLCKQLVALRKAAVEQPLGAICEKEFTARLRSYSSGVGRGIDRIGAAQVKQLPWEALLDLIALFALCEKELAWPAQLSV